MHLLDRAESDIRFVVQIEADIGQSKDEFNISPNLYNLFHVLTIKTNYLVGRVLFNLLFNFLEIL